MTRKTARTIATLAAFLLLAPSLAWGTEVRPYMKVGYLVLAPDAGDLGYVSVDDEDLDEFLDVSKTNFGIGLQVFPEFARIENRPMRLGLDVGFQKLYSSEFQTYESSMYEENEYDLTILGVLEYAPAAWEPVFFQVGAGIHSVFWSYDYEHEGYVYISSEASGTDINLGFMGAAGLNLKAAENLNVPVMVRIDDIFRYGQTASVSVLAGVTFSF